MGFRSYRKRGPMKGRKLRIGIALLLISLLSIPNLVRADYPQVISSNGGTSLNDNSNTLVSLPSGIALNDMIILFMEWKIVAFSGAISVGGNGTWTSLIDNFDQFRIKAFWHLGIAGEGKVWINTTAGNVKKVWQVFRIGGPYNSSMPPAVNSLFGAGLNPDPPSLTPSWGSNTTLWFAFACTSSRDSGTGLDVVQTIPTVPVNYLTIRGTDGSGGSGDPKMNTAKRNLTAASENPGGFTLGTSDLQWFAATVAIRPAIPAPPGPTPFDWSAVYLTMYASVLVGGMYVAWKFKEWRET